MQFAAISFRYSASAAARPWAGALHGTAFRKPAETVAKMMKYS
jgi:hypothetical protein